MLLSRRNRFWLGPLLALAMVFTIAGSPALAAACAMEPLGGIPSAIAAPASACDTMGSTDPCCCSSDALAATSDNGFAAAPRGALTRPGCECSLEAPTAPPAPDVKAAWVGVSTLVALLPRSAVALRLPDHGSCPVPETADGAPRRASRASGPSRAPPAR